MICFIQNIVCEIPKRFERSSPSNFRTQGSFIHINSGKVSNPIFFRQIALQNLQRKNLAFSETEIGEVLKIKYKTFVPLLIKQQYFLGHLVPEISFSQKQRKKSTSDGAQ